MRHNKSMPHMKTIDQIYRFTSDCRFSDEDWRRVLDFYREHYNSGRIYRRTENVADCTFAQFKDWVDNGYGSGDIVGYGNTYGIVSRVTPGKVTLAAYYDFDGNIMLKDLRVMEPQRLFPASDEQKLIFRDKLRDAKKMFSVVDGKLVELFTPKKFSYVRVDYGNRKPNDFGMYLESEGDSYRFAILVRGGEVYPDEWVSSKYALLRPATNTEIKRINDLAAKQGLAFSDISGRYVKINKRKKGVRYWYITDRFELASDIDNATKRHAERFDVGNYFTSRESGYAFYRKLHGIIKNSEEER